MPSKLDCVVVLASIALAPSAAAQSLVRTFVPPVPVYFGDGFGTSVAFVGDANLDGVGDYAVGSPQDIFFDPGRVTVVSGSDGTTLQLVAGPSIGSAFGYRLATVGDLDGDGVSDLLTCAPDPTQSNPLGTELRLFSTVAGGTIWSLSVSAAFASFLPPFVGGGRDVTGDGVPDFAVSGYFNATQATMRVYSGATLTFVYAIGVALPKHAEGPIAFLGDLDGDGRSETACGVTSGNLWEVAIASGATGAVLRTCTLSAPTNSIYISLTALGDIDGDGKGDLAFGAAEQFGRVDVFSGATGAPIRTHTGTELNAYFGWAISGGVDLDRDGVGDLLVGAPESDGPASSTGRVYTFSGRTGAPIESCAFASSSYDKFGSAVAGAGDGDADGFGDYFVGAPGHASSYGHAYLVTSTPLPVRAIGSSQVNSHGCTPAVMTTGSASATNASLFTIQASQLLNKKTGTLFYGLGDPVSAPFHGWLRYAPGPLRRTPHVSTGGSSSGTDCSGSLVFDFNAHIASGADPALAIGSRVVAQFYSRDPAAPSTTNLTSAVEFVVNP